MCDYVCYTLLSANGRCTYVGVTNNMDRRLRQHNGALVGGAKYTSAASRQPWRVVCTITGFRNQVEALQFEWALHHATRVARRSFGSGLPARWRKLQYVCAKARWTSLAPPAADVSLRIAVQEVEHTLDAAKLPPHVTVVHAGQESNVMPTRNGGAGGGEHDAAARTQHADRA